MASIDDRPAMTDRRLEMARLAAMLAVALLLGWWAFPRAVEDWRFQLAGLANPLHGRPAPSATIFLGVVITTVVVLIASVAHRRGRTGIPSALLVPLVVGWVAYAVGAGLTVVAGGQTNYPGRLQYTFRGPLDHTATVPATCRTPVGQKSLLGIVEPTVGGPVAVGGLPVIRLRHAATGASIAGGPDLERFEISERDITVLSTFSIPSLAHRPLPYMVVTAGPGEPEQEPPIGFLDAYDFVITSSTDSGFGGEAVVSATRWLDLVEGGEVHWVNLTMPDDPWPDSFELSVAWSCAV
jgi:hypothetical protein